ncbi:caspase family protein [Hallerella succinigenes]|uniref:Caspase domain-containing protein n=1 Tax=Hallerella succinigenes TaxID=1896222 RepID=A0A2M9A4E4_9BACT|nr:caspase family protein [Hallerella succinigenes]PJJ40513.1 caspase domain-containing protein [Hallerella succinigenes]
MRKALIVGINYYKSRFINNLKGCVNDATNVARVLTQNADDTVNFECNVCLAKDRNSSISSNELRESIRTLFAGDDDIALLYFSGHGYCDSVGGYLISSDSRTGCDGVTLNEVVTLANQSKCKNKIIILDCCHSGVAAENPISGVSEIKEGVVILTACTKIQPAMEKGGEGIFTSLLVDALNGSAANLIGNITPGSVYAYIDQSLGAWEQRPVFKANVKNFVSLRKTQPTISLDDLHKLVSLFPTSNYEYPLNPTYEPEMKGRSEGMPGPILENTQKFAILQKYNRVNLLVPVDAPHMWHAAMWSKSCKLTALGRFYHMLVQKGRI